MARRFYCGSPAQTLLRCRADAGDPRELPPNRGGFPLRCSAATRLQTARQAQEQYRNLHPLEGPPLIQTAAEFVQLRTSDDPVEQARASNDEATEQVWLDVIRVHPEMRRWVAHNKTVPASILDLLATDADPEVRWEVAGKRKLSAELLRTLAEDQDDTVRVRVARNPRTDVDVVRMLAADESRAGRSHFCSQLARGYPWLVSVGHAASQGCVRTRLRRGPPAPVPRGGDDGVSYVKRGSHGHGGT